MNVNWDYGAGSAIGAPGVWIDPAFARGAVFADSHAVDTVVRPACDVALDAECEVVNVGYVPGRELRVVYRFTSPTRERVVRVDFPSAGASFAAWEHATRTARRPADVVRLEAWDAVAWILPEDDRLPSLGPLLNPGSGPKLVAAAIGERGDGGFGPGRLLAYVPRRRAVARFDGSRPVIAKAGRMRDERDCHVRQQTLWELPGRRFLIPRPLGVDSEHGIRVEGLVNGRPLEDVIAEDPTGPAIGGVMASLAAIHSLPAGFAAHRIGAADLVEQLSEKTLDRLVATLPDRAGRLTALAGALAETVPVASRHATLHGDFHPGNVLMSADGPVVIDLDNLAVGPVERDLAVFAGRLVLLGLKDGWGDDATRLAFEVPDRYRDAGGGAVDDEAFGWYLAMTMLVRQISNAVRRLAPNLPAVADACLEVGEQALSGSATIATGG